jgi:hypothetical protein
MTGLLTISWGMTTNPFGLRFYGVGQPCCLGVHTEARAGFDRLNPNGGGKRHPSPFGLSLLTPARTSLAHDARALRQAQGERIWILREIKNLKKCRGICLVNF